jgi:hypothetical protein
MNREEEKFRYPPGITRGKRHVPVMIRGQFLSFLPPKFGKNREFFLLFKK